MSSREASVSLSASKSQTNTKKVRKFKFSDLSLSYQVRKRLYEMLISFDDNVNYEFEKEQIKRALAEILEQNQSQLAYVINNVFRYDVNRDGVVTYEQFSNFCLQQHFGQMAIQRLHRTDLYSRGKERIMSCSQFVSTLNYCLSFIEVQPRKEVLQAIFRDADLDKDGYIAYSDYFILLKQYFGSQSQSANVIKIASVEEDLKKAYGNVDKKIIKEEIFKQKIQKLKENPKAATNGLRIQAKPIILTPNIQASKIEPKPQLKIETKPKQHKSSEQVMAISQRISKLIYLQVKISIIQHDNKMMLSSDEAAARYMLAGIMNISQIRARKIIQAAFEGQPTISYERLAQFAVEKFMCQDVPDRIVFPVDKEKFAAEVLRNLHFIKAKPSSYLLEELFQKFNTGDKIYKPDFYELMNIIFSSHRWVRKTGELRNNGLNLNRIGNDVYKI